MMRWIIRHIRAGILVMRKAINKLSVMLTKLIMRVEIVLVHGAMWAMMRAERKSVQALVRQRDTSCPWWGYLCSREETLVHRDLDKDRGIGRRTRGDPASHHAPEDREDQEGHYRQERPGGGGGRREAGVGVEVEAQMVAEEGEEAGEEEDHPERACYGHELYGPQTQGQKPWRIG